MAEMSDEPDLIRPEEEGGSTAVAVGGRGVEVEEKGAAHAVRIATRDKIIAR